MAKTLEQKILNKVYRFEARRTFLEVLGLGAALILSAASVYWLVRFVYVELIEQSTFDLLEIWREDWEVIRGFSGEVIVQFFDELPKPAVTLLIMFLLVLAVLLLIFAKNYRLILNRIKSIRSFRNAVSGGHPVTRSKV